LRQWLALGTTTGVIYRTRNLRSLQENPSWIPSYRFLASCYAHLGKLDEARELIRPGRALAAGPHLRGVGLNKRADADLGAQSRTAVAIIDHCQVGRLLTGLRPPTLTSTI